MGRGAELRPTGLVDIVSAASADEVAGCVGRVEKAVGTGLYAAGYIAYEAAPAFNRDLAVHHVKGAPALWFGLYKDLLATPRSPTPDRPFTVGPWRPLIGRDEYMGCIAHIRELIAAGDTYQVNYTFPMTASFDGDAFGWFRRLCEAQRTDVAAYVDTGRFKIVSASPELFFRLEDGLLETRPMKGTRRRGRWPEEDRRAAAALAASEKERAENVMIVDLLRNDMGRVSTTGSVSVARLFELERYDTVWQMTSTIRSRTEGTVPEVLGALFPSGSVTGAPKIRTMQIIRDVEPFPRGVYCGAVGWWGPGRRACFNVAIRTATVDSEQGTAQYHVGGGITWSSTAESEYDECLAKAEVVKHERPEFRLLESVLFDGEFFLLDAHLNRLGESAAYFGFAVDLCAIRRALTGQSDAFGTGPVKVRLLVARDGVFCIEPERAAPAMPVRAGFAASPVDDRDVFLYHKTTHRGVYDRAQQSRPDCDDVLLWNKRGEVTESATANVAVRLDGQWLTPPVECGLLPGTMRAHLLERGVLREAILTKGDVARAEAVHLINSVRKRAEAVFVP
ncbi:MAG: aminodeoxychorismate synthase component I [Candidatus Hydrogenedentes bacterium]|nr:aminodeoxychorismate synthase component I [Candidatus Hydrogenedentota bacterium]